MYVIIWEYHLSPADLAEFEKIYGENGLWAELFQRQNGYLGTELLQGPNDPHHYLTIDRWASRADYDSFRSKWTEDYEKLDAQCEGLMEQETSLGEWEAIPRETR